MPQSEKQYLNVNMPTVFGAGKAYSLSITNGKFRLSIASLSGDQWDFRNSTGITFDHEDLNRIISACQDMVRIMIALKRDPSVVAASSNPMLQVRHIRIPLVAKMTKTEYGGFTVGITDDSGEKDGAFYFQYNYHRQTQDQMQNIEDYFIFKRGQGVECELQYFNARKEVIRHTPHVYLMFANFLTSLNTLHRYGKFYYGFYSMGKFSNNNTNPGASKLGEGPGISESTSKPFIDDIPF
jgi:hypothetical protein